MRRTVRVTFKVATFPCCPFHDESTSPPMYKENPLCVLRYVDVMYSCEVLLIYWLQREYDFRVSTCSSLLYTFFFLPVRDTHRSHHWGWRRGRHPGFESSTNWLEPPPPRRPPSLLPPIDWDVLNRRCPWMFSFSRAHRETHEIAWGILATDRPAWESRQINSNPNCTNPPREMGDGRTTNQTRKNHK